MKSSKILAFLTVFVMVLGNAFIALPTASACTPGKVEIQIQKLDASTGKAVATAGQARFTVERRDNSSGPYSTVQTNLPDGQTSNAFNPGDFRITETTAPTGYQLNTTPLEFTLGSGDTGKITTKNFSDQPIIPSITVTKSVSGGTPPNGTVFTFSLYDKSGTKYTQVGASQNVIWGTNSSVTFGGAGYNLQNNHTYYVRESAPSGYAAQDSAYTGNGKSVTATCAGASLACTNNMLAGSVKVTKTMVSGQTTDQTFIFDLTRASDGYVYKSAPVAQNGNYVFNNLPYGDYTITEEGKSGFSSTPQFSGDVTITGGIVHICVKGSSQLCVTCKNQKLTGSIVVNKSFSPNTNSPMTLTFELYKNGSDTGISKTINWPGQNSCTFDSLDFGATYKVYEKNVPNGYSSNLSGGSADITIASATPYAVSCTNTKLVQHGSIVVNKSFSPNTTDPMTLTFELYENGSDTGISKTINWPGQNSCTFDNLDLGATYKVYETNVPSGYTSNLSSGSAGITINCSTPYNVCCTNTKIPPQHGSIVVNKSFSPNTTDPMTLTFELYKNGSDTGISKTINWPGQNSCTFDNLDLGATYKVYETNVPSGYTSDLSAGSAGITINCSTPYNVCCTNTKIPPQHGSIVVNKSFSPNTTDPMTLTFELYKNGSDTGISKTINWPGQNSCTFDNLDFGATYKVYETNVPSGYTSDLSAGSAGITINCCTPYSISCTNTKIPPQHGSIAVTKDIGSEVMGDSDQFTFTLYKGTDNTGELVGSHTITNSTGMTCTFDNLEYGQYYLAESATGSFNGPTSWSGDINSGNVVNVNGDMAVTCTNSKLHGSIAVTKDIGSEVMGDSDQFTFTLYKGTDNTGELVGSHTITNSTGMTCTFDNLEYGQYYLAESATGSFNGSTSWSGDINSGNVVNVNGDMAVTCTNSKFHGSITVTKDIGSETMGDSDKFTFSLYQGSTATGTPVATHDFVKGSSLTYKFDGLEYGPYCLTESSTGSFNGTPVWTGDIDPATGDVTVAGDMSVTCANSKLYGSVTVAKDVTNVDHDPTEFTIDIDGTSGLAAGYHGTAVITEDTTKVLNGLPFGDYKVTEDAKADYQTTGITVKTGSDTKSGDTFSIGADNYTADIRITVSNCGYASLKIVKLSSLTGQGVPGTHFKVYHMAGGNQVVDAADVVTGADGTVTVTGLQVGITYFADEIQAAPGFNLIPATREFDLTDPSGTPVLANAVEGRDDGDFVNQPIGRIMVVKKDSYGTALEGFQFAIYPTEADANNGTGQIGLMITDGSGKATSVDLVLTGDPTTFWVKEMGTYGGFIPDTTAHPVTITYADRINSDGVIVPAELDLTDTAYGSAVIEKVDSISGDPIAGAEFTLYSDSACTVKVGNAVTTGTDGIARFDNLAPGDYWVMETAAPTNYDKLTAAVPLTVTAGATDPDPIVLQDTYNPPHGYQTGMMDWNFLIIGGLAVLAGLLLVVLTRKRRAYIR